jgi:phosphoesterase RecJ-like protein
VSPKIQQTKNNKKGGRNMYENNILKDIENAELIAVAGHLNPDGDAVSSSFAFASFLEKLGKKAVVLLEGYDEKFNMLYGKKFVYSGDYAELNPDVFFALDCGSIDRLRDAQAVFERSKFTYNIDHHISNTNYADVNIVNGSASSTCEVVFELIHNLIDIDKETATAIYTGLLTDTGGFMHNCTSKRTHEIAGRLVELGVDTPNVHTKILCEHSISQAKLFGVAISKMQITEGKIASSLVTKADFALCGATQSDLDGICEFMLNTKGIDVAVLASERDNGYTKLSFRSKSVNVSEICVSLGGGGHKLAAGAGIVSEPKAAVDMAVDLLKEKIKNEKQ